MPFLTGMAKAHISGFAPYGNCRLLLAPIGAEITGPAGIAAESGTEVALSSDGRASSSRLC